MPDWFKRDFFAVCEHYKCSEEEIKVMKKIAWADFEEAKRCYYAIAREIENVVSAADMVIEPKIEQNKEWRK